MNKLLEEKSGRFSSGKGRYEDIEAVEDENLMREANSIFGSNKSRSNPFATREETPSNILKGTEFTDLSLVMPEEDFHQFVMQFRNNLNSPQLEKALLSITETQFKQLRGNSSFLSF
jgi:hypothetical protein